MAPISAAHRREQHTPAIRRALIKDGWFRVGKELYHPETPDRYLPERFRRLSNDVKADIRANAANMPNRRQPIDEDGMRRVMREHRNGEGIH